MSQLVAQKRIMSTKQLVIIAVFIAIAAILSYIEIPLMPAAPYLKYDPSGVVALVTSLIFGPLAGSFVAVLSWVPHMLTNPIGSVMNIAASLAMIIPAGLIYRQGGTIGKAVSGMALGIVLSVIISIALNFIATPLYFGGSVADVMKMVLPILLPFNLIKLFLNCGITLIVYKTISKLIKGNEAQD